MFFTLSFLFIFILVSQTQAASTTYTTFIGDDLFDQITSTAVLGDGSIIVVGRSQSANYPTTSGAFDTGCGINEACGGGALALGDVTVSKFDAAGGLTFSTFIGGDGDDGAHDVAIAPDGSIVVVGYTRSGNFPTTAGAFATGSTQIETGNSGDAFIVRLSSNGSQLLYGSYIGGNQNDEIKGVALNGSDIYFAGFTTSSDFPTTSGTFDTTHNGNTDAFVGKLNNDGSALSYSTFLGGDGTDFVVNLAVTSAGKATVVGSTTSTNYPTTAGAFDTVSADFNEGLVTQLNASGSALSYSTFIGGNSFDRISDIDLDNSGNAYLIGTTNSTDLPATVGAFDATKSNQDDSFFTILNSGGTAVTYFTYTSHVSSGRASGVAVDLADDGTVFLGVSWTETGNFGDRVPYFLQLDPAGNGAADLLFDCRLCFRFDEGFLNDIKVGPNGVIVVGETNDSTFAVTPGAFDTTFNGESDGFIIALSTPTTDDVDTFATLPDFAAGQPTQNVSIPITFGNLGSSEATTVQITATLDASLTYMSDSSGVAPAANGNQLTWNLTNLPFSETDSFNLVLQLPNVALGSTFPLGVTISSDGPEAIPANNSDTIDILVATQLYLPLIMK